MTAEPAAVIPSDKAALKRSIHHHIVYSLGKAWTEASPEDLYLAVALSVRDRALDARFATDRRYEQADAKRLYYLSMEFLIGRLLGNSLYNLGLWEIMEETVADLGHSLEDLCEIERDAGLGNGGLGRLAACFLESLATLHMPGYGYGLYYEYGLFRQEIEGGCQKERPDRWQGPLMPWGMQRYEEKCLIPIYGTIVHGEDRDGRYNPMWLDWKFIVGVPHDIPVIGWGGRTVNTLRLYAAQASDEFDMEIFNEGDYIRAVEQKMRSETVSRVLYPSDAVSSGKELRLLQEYFFVACSIRDIVNRYRRRHADFTGFDEKVAIQLNDTHPALAVAELMRLFVDEAGLPWEEAWGITRRTFAYTNHTLLPEALEKWPVSLLEHLIPRHLQVIFEINRRFLDDAAVLSLTDPGFPARVSIIEEGGEKQVRMAHLAIIGSHSVNGVAALHSELVKNSLVPDFNRLWPERFNNKTNGVTPRRWMVQANPELAAMISEVIGPGWEIDLDELRRLEPLADDAAFRRRFREVKRANKERLAAIVQRENGITLDLDALFDVQVKRLHEYKRQLLNVMHIVAQYLRMKADPSYAPVPRAYLFGAKAAPGYAMAKWHIKLINAVADVVNHDIDVRGRIAVVFLRNYRVSLAERIFPAADLSEQISTAGKEASGTGNMKFAMNGALTIGTLDGANVEIREEAGAENFFLFGLHVEQVKELKRRGYDPWEYYRQNRELKAVIDAIAGGTFSPGQPRLFQPVVDSLLNGGDPYLCLADFADYLRCQEEVSQAWRDPERWTRMTILNVARMGKFSSDRSIHEYAEDIWHVKPVRIVG